MALDTAELKNPEWEHNYKTIRPYQVVKYLTSEILPDIKSQKLA